MTFWPSLFTPAASNVNLIEVYRSNNIFQKKTFERDDAHVALSTINKADSG
jgi:hypothetical protein